MKTIRRTCTTIAAATIFGGLAHERDASAYNAGTHQRIVEAAIESMTFATGSQAPLGIQPQEWASFTSFATEAVTRLTLLQTGLEAPYAGSATLGSPRVEPVTI